MHHESDKRTTVASCCREARVSFWAPTSDLRCFVMFGKTRAEVKQYWQTVKAVSVGGLSGRKMWFVYQNTEEEVWNAPESAKQTRLGQSELESDVRNVGQPIRMQQTLAFYGYQPESWYTFVAQIYNAIEMHTGFRCVILWFKIFHY